MIRFIIVYARLLAGKRGVLGMNINCDRLWKQLMELGEIGKDPEGGVTRLAFTEEEKEAKSYVAKLMKEAGMTVYVDAIGNLFGRFEGIQSDLPAVLIGSHIDSVFNGGRFDGTAGVISAIEVVRTLKEKDLHPQYPIEVVAFTDEEGARFSTGMLGSKALCGELSLEELHIAKDKQNISIWDAMKQAGYDPEKIGSAKRNPATIKAYLELHIEQGKVLESKGLPVGVVTGIAGPLWFRFTLYGEAGHAGATPMFLRKDPMTAAAKIILSIEEIVKGRPSTVATVGALHTQPGGINVIPGTVQFSLDLRDISELVRDKIEKEIIDTVSNVCRERGILYEIEELDRTKPGICSSKMVELISKSCRDANLPIYKLPSGAFHDAVIISSISDIGMIFVRSKDGISHNPKEWSDPADLAFGAEVLFNTVCKLAMNV